MKRLQVFLWAGVTACVLASPAAAGRMISGGHPYHNGYHFIPPASAWDPVRLRPPIWYGAPAYYFPGAYLGEQRSFYPPADYPYVPASRAGSYYLSAHGFAATYPW